MKMGGVLRIVEPKTVLAITIKILSNFQFEQWLSALTKMLHYQHAFSEIRDNQL